MDCNICNRFQGRWPIDGRVDREKHKGQGIRSLIIPKLSWGDILTSAELCYGCNIIVAGCRGCFGLHVIDEASIVRCSLRFLYPSVLEDVEDADTDKHITFYMASGQRFEVELFATDDDDAPIPHRWDYIPSLNRTSPRTDSTTALATIKGWLARCIVDHCTPDSLCDTPARPELPTRVVDVGSGGNVKVVETKGARANYICLSHCWGLEQIITTTQSTLKERMKAVEWKSLSKTFQDAIALTRALGFQYIWIDSLCIIQDNLRDWEIESAKMASVYSNGHLTIAATRSSSGSGGLYTQTPDCEVSGTTPDGEEYRLFFRERIDHQIDAGFETSEFTATETYYPLLSRAWVYQERMLSTRVLHFGQYELFFECKSSIDCECGSIHNHGTGQETPLALIKIEYADNLSEYDIPRDEQSLADVLYQTARLWRTMVCCYTALFLTKSYDRLPAIGGLARQLHSKRMSKYLAGLWEDTLHDDLLWNLYTTSKLKKPRPYPRNAPTWSWASVETFVGYGDAILFTDIEGSLAERREPVEHYSTIEGCTIEKLAIDEFGSIEHGTLTITGLVVEGVLGREVESHEDGERIIHYAIVPEARLPVATDYLLDHEGPGQTTPGTPVFCLRMSLLQLGEKESLVSLVLKESRDNPNTFERIGTSSLTVNRGFVDARREVLNTAHSQTLVIV